VIDELEAIRERHQEAEHDNNSNWATDHGAQAHFDRETLLRLLDAARAELAEISAWTDDDQRGLNAAVADAMWHWDDMPMDCDDAIVLTSVLKSSLQDNGFQIVRLAAALAKDATT
jgi:hypothetical protein